MSNKISMLKKYIYIKRNQTKLSFEKYLLIALLWTPFSSIAQGVKPPLIDSSIYFQALQIQGKKYTVLLTSSGCYILNTKKDTILRERGDYFGLKCLDFNQDGFPDVFLEESSNTPEMYSLLLYDPLNGRFKKVKNFDLFPSPTRIARTKYYYSYHKNGCADLDWVSDLFYLDHFRTKLIGKIHGSGCEPDTNQSIHIYKVNGPKQILYKILPISIINSYRDSKWGFIKQYWSKKYTRFL